MIIFLLGRFNGIAGVDSFRKPYKCLIQEGLSLSKRELRDQAIVINKLIIYEAII
jgi:hypothetical protein